MPRSRPPASPAAARTASACSARAASRAKLAFRVAGVSAGAREAVEKAGGSVEVIEVVPAAEKAAAKKGSVKKRQGAAAQNEG